MNWLGEYLNSNNFIWEFISQLCSSLYSGWTYVMQEMIKLLVAFPLIREISGVHAVWKMILLTSLTCVALIFVYVAAKNLFSVGNSFIRHTEMKVVFARMIYMMVFIMGSLPFIDWMIIFNNTLIGAIISKFGVAQFITDNPNKTFAGDLIASLLAIYQIYLAVKIIVGYWFRVAETNLMVAVSPIMFTLWMNPSWGGYLGIWLSRLMVLVFTQFVQVLILVLYNQMFVGFLGAGTLSSLALAVATLMLMDKVPDIFKQFSGGQNGVDIMANAVNTMRGIPTNRVALTQKIKDSILNRRR
jgi:hypothetical protein